MALLFPLGAFLPLAVFCLARIRNCLPRNRHQSSASAQLGENRGRVPVRTSYDCVDRSLSYICRAARSSTSSEAELSVANDDCSHHYECRDRVVSRAIVVAQMIVTPARADFFFQLRRPHQVRRIAPPKSSTGYSSRRVDFQCYRDRIPPPLGGN